MAPCSCPVGLPFFVDASIAPEYLVADRPTIVVRTFGSALAAGAPVTIQVTSPERSASTADRSRRRRSRRSPFRCRRSTAGHQTVTISATTGTGSTPRTDRLTRTFRVVDTRLTRHADRRYVELAAGQPLQGRRRPDDRSSSPMRAAGRYLPLLTRPCPGRRRPPRSRARGRAGGRDPRRPLRDRPATPAPEPFVADRYQD